VNSVIRFSYLCIALLCCTCNKTGPPPGPRPSLPVQTDRNFYTVDLNNANSPEGQILLALNSKSKGVIFSLDRQGALMWEKSIGVTVENLQKWVVNGKTLFTYFHSEGTIPLDDIPGTKLGYEYICDSALNIIDSVKLKTSGLIDVRVQDKLDVHEFILLGEKHYIYETYYSLAPDNIPDSLHPAPGVKVAACVIQELNTTLWECLMPWRRVPDAIPPAAQPPLPVGDCVDAKDSRTAMPPGEVQQQSRQTRRGRSYGFRCTDHARTQTSYSERSRR